MFGLRRKPKVEDIEESASINEPSKPKRRRRRKDEPPKPWGKKERLLVLSVLVVTLAVASVLALKAREWKLPGLPRIAPPKGIFEQTYVFEGKPSARDTGILIREFSQLTQSASGVYGLYVVNLNTGETYGVNEDEVFTAASLIKLPVMAAMFGEHEDGNIDLEDIYTLRDEDRVGGSGSIVSRPTGSEYSYRELVAAMGHQSDNTAYTACLNLLGRDLVKNYITEFGMLHTSLEENQTTPRDVGVFFKNLWTRKMLDRSSRDELLKYLTGTIYESWLPAGIPGVRVAHKFGRDARVVNDAGIVFAEEPYVLVIMSKGVVESQADKLIPDLAALVHRFETQSI